MTNQTYYDKLEADNVSLHEQVRILTTQRDGYKKELEDQNEINVKLGKALDSSQEEVKSLVFVKKTLLEKVEELESRVKDLEVENKIMKGIIESNKS